MAAKYDLTDLIHTVEHNIHSELHTSMPGKIVTYYPATQTADVQLQLYRVYWSDTEAEDGTPAGHKVYARYPLLANVPVQFPSGSGFVVTFPLGAGDQVEVVFHESSIADYLMTGAEAKQQDVGRHRLGYAVAHPIFCPTNVAALTDSAITDNDRMVIGQAGGVQIQIDGTNIILGAGATDYVALASKVDGNFANIITALAAAIAAAVPNDGGKAALTALKTALSTGGADAFAEVAASVTKAK